MALQTIGELLVILEKNEVPGLSWVRTLLRKIEQEDEEKLRNVLISEIEVQVFLILIAEVAEEKSRAAPEINRENIFEILSSFFATVKEILKKDKYYFSEETYNASIIGDLARSGRPAALRVGQLGKLWNDEGQ